MLRLVAMLPIRISSKFDNYLQPLVSAFKAARYLSPTRLKPSAIDMDAFKAFPFPTTELIEGLKCELAESLSTEEDISDQIDVVERWKQNEQNGRMPHWTEICRLVMLVQPSSAEAEQVFSLLNAFTSQQEFSLEDHLQLSLMLIKSFYSVLHFGEKNRRSSIKNRHKEKQNRQFRLCFLG